MTHDRRRLDVMRDVGPTHTRAPTHAHTPTPTNAPLAVHRRDGADVVLAGKHKVRVEAPWRLHVQDGGRVDGHDLVVLHGQVLPRLLQVRHLFWGFWGCCSRGWIFVED